MMIRLTLLIALLFCTSCAFLKSHLSAKEKIERIDELMNYAYQNGIFNGSILVSDSGQVIYEKSFGKADFRTYEGLNSRTTFYIASLTKSFTAMAIMILKEQGKLEYDDQITTYLPEFIGLADAVTIRHLLTHTSGLPDYFQYTRQRIGLKNNDVKQLLLQLNRLDFTPGTRFYYSNSGYVLLSEIIQKVTGQTYQDYMNEAIFTPLDLKNTFIYDTNYSPIENRAVGFDEFKYLHDYINLTTGDVGIFSTLEDMYKWDRSLYTHKLISDDTFEEAIQYHRLKGKRNINYGFGWVLRDIGGVKTMMHSGRIAGYRTHIRRYLDTKSSFILLANIGDASPEEISKTIDKIFLGESYELPKIPLSVNISDILQEDFMDAAMPRIREVINTNDPKYIKDEAGINKLGYSFVRYKNKNIPLAAKLFEINTELFPESWNVYDSYGESLMLLGNTPRAIMNYKKSIRLNPDNMNAYRMLSQMNADSVYQIQTEILKNYTGTYEVQPNFLIDILVENDRIYSQPTNQRKFEMLPISETRFYLKSTFAGIVFNTDSKNKVTSLTLIQNGSQTARKVK